MSDCKEAECYRDSCEGCSFNDDLTFEDMTLDWAQQEEINIPEFNNKGERVG